MRQIGLLNAGGCLDEIEWTLALEAFTDTERRDISLLAKLFRSGKAVPSEISREFGVFLDPPEGYRGPTLYPKFPARSRSSADAYQRLLEKWKLGQRIRELKGSGKLEAALHQVMRETGKSRSALLEAYRLDAKEILRQRLSFIGYGKSKESE